MSIFSKLNSKEYNDKLEKILEDKNFDETVKNLLLSMFYKIENGYNDYEKVKVNSVSKKEFIETILNIIDKECLELEIVIPQTKQSKPLEQENKNCKIDLDRGSILVYANEEDLLYSLIRLHLLHKENNTNNKSQTTYYEKAIKEFILNAKCINDTEIIRDFDGWSWNNNIESNNNIEYNLIFQNILMSDINIDSKEFYTTKYIHNINLPYKFEKSMYILMLTLSAENNELIKNEIHKEKNEKENILQIMNNKTQYLSKITEEKKQLGNEIKRIDELLNNKEKLEKEYDNRNSKLENKEKIFSVNRLVNILKEDRKQKLEELKLKNKLIEPKEYLRKKEEIENEYQILKSVTDNLENKDKKRKEIINIQYELLKGMAKQIEDIKDKENLEKILYKFRYYCLLPISKDEKIKDIKELHEEIDNVINIIIDNCIYSKVITNFSNSASLCYHILKHIFVTKITDLKEINIRINKNREEKSEGKKIYYININIYDEKQEENVYEEIVNNLELLQVKLNKKIPLFIK